MAHTITFSDGTMLASYSYAIGIPGTESQERVAMDCVRMKLPRAVPHILLDGKTLGNGTRFDAGNYHVQKIKLEGNFPDKFDLYAPPKYQIDALQIFTPDVMAALLDNGQRYDFEFIGDELWSYAPDNTINHAETLQAWLTALAVIVPEITKQVSTYSDHRAGDVQSGAVANAGAKLKSKTLGKMISKVTGA
jgi:hypothetical protein